LEEEAPLPPSQKRVIVVGMSYKVGVGVMRTKVGMMSYFKPNSKVVLGHRGKLGDPERIK
jgi:hypothetical protein